MPEQTRIPRIDVVGRRLRGFGPNPFGLFIGRPGAEGGVFGGGSRGDPGGTGPRSDAFRSPGLPGVIDEIIVTAPRPGTTVARTGLAGIIGLGVGFVAAEFLRQISQDRLDEIGRLAVEPVQPKPDTPVVVEPAPAPLPEVVVTAKRLAAVREFVLPPLPTFTPFRDLPDPFILQPIGPGPTLPQPKVTPDVVTIPTPAPFRVPSPGAPLPLRRPLVVPLPIPTFAPLPRTPVAPAPFAVPVPVPTPTPQPITQPVPFPRTQPQPRDRTRPLTGTRTGVLPSPLGRPLASPQPRVAGCPPCPKPRKKKDEQKLRDKCWKKLVKEGPTADLDEEFQWTEIDCLTGREL